MTIGFKSFPVPEKIMRHFSYLKTSLFALGLVALSTSVSYAETKFTFGLWGDMPYAKAKDQEKMPALLDSINSSDIAFSIYDGDIKDGSSKCTDVQHVEAADGLCAGRQ